MLVCTTVVSLVLSAASFGSAFVTPNSNRIIANNPLPVSDIGASRTSPNTLAQNTLGGGSAGRLQTTLLFEQKDDVDFQPFPPKPPTPPQDMPVTDDEVESERLQIPVREIPKQVSIPPPRTLTPEEQKLTIAAAVGGLFVGGLLGGIIDLQNPDIDLYVSPIIPPAIGALSLSAFGFVAGGTDGALGNVVRKTLGGTTIAVGNGIVAVVRGAVDNAVDSAKNKVKETTDEIKAIPGNIQKAAVKKVEDTKEEIAQIPGKIQAAAVETATEIAEEIKATPGRVAQKTRQAVEDAVDDTLDAVEEFVDDVKALPKKAIEGVEESINSLLGKPPVPRPPLAPPDMDPPKQKETTPVPPKAPPVVAEKQKPLIPKIESLKIETPKLEIPKIEPPKFDLPKIEIPKPPSKDKPDTPKGPPPSPPAKSVDRVKLTSVRKDILFDERTGRFFESGTAPKIEAPKIEIPKLEVPKFSLPLSEPKTESASPAAKADDGAERRKRESEEKRKAAEEARKAAALKKKEEADAKAEEARLRKEEADKRRVEAAEKARQVAEERQRAQEKAREEKLEAQRKAEELRKQQVEERRKQVEASREAQAEKAKKLEDERKTASLRVKRQQAVEKSLGQVKSRTTISLGSLFGLGSNEEESSESAPASPSTPVSKPPRGIPLISSWRQNPDGSITGKISGSPRFSDGEGITTSPVPQGATSGSIVKTSSGSSYFLGSKAAFGFSFGGGAPAPVETSKPVVDPRAEARRIAEEKKAAAQAAFEERKAEAARRTREAEEKKAAAQAATEARQKAAEAKKKAEEERKAAAEAAAVTRKQAAEAKKRAEEERKAAANAAAEAAAEAKKKAEEERKAAAEARKQAAEKQKAAAEAAANANKQAEEERKATAEARKQAAEKQRAEAEAKKKAEEERKAAVEARKQAAEKQKALAEAEAKKKAEEERKAAADAAAEARRQALEAKQKAAEERKAAAEAAAEEKRKAAEERKAAIAAAAEEKKRAIEQRRSAAAATVTSSNQVPPSVLKAEKVPSGVPVIKSWKKRADGGVSGRIYNSRSFADGDFVETSPITQGAIENGSVVGTKSGSRYFLSAEPAVKKTNILAAIKDLAGAEPGATITLTRERKQREAKAAMEAIEKAKPRSTFSLFGLGFGEADQSFQPSPTPSPKAAPKIAPKAAPKVAPKAAPNVAQQRPVINKKVSPAPAPAPKKIATAPRGVPTLSSWKKNSDGSVTGIISGSNAFDDGERVTTSMIKKGTIAKNEVVITGSGSRYFLG